MVTQSNVAQRARGKLVDVKGAAEYLGTTERHIRRLVDEDRIPRYKLGAGRSARLRFDTADLEAWLGEHYQPAGG